MNYGWNSFSIVAIVFGSVVSATGVVLNINTINLLDDLGMTLLMHAALGGDAVECQNLVDTGALVSNDFGPLVSKEGENVLHFAAKSGNQTVVDYFLHQSFHLDINAVTEEGNTALMFAVRNGYIDSCAVLIRAGANLLIQNEDGESALYKAIFWNHIPIFTLLIENGADVTQTNHLGMNGLEYLIKRGQYSSASILRILGVPITPSGELLIYRLPPESREKFDAIYTNTYFKMSYEYLIALYRLNY